MSRNLFVKQLLLLAHVIWNQTKRQMLVKVKHVVNRNKRQVFIKWQQVVYIYMGCHIWGTNCWRHYCKTSWVIKNKKRHTFVSKIYWSYLWKLAMHEIWLSFIITTQDKEMKIWEWNMEFIVGVQNLTQHGKSKWWRNQPRWLVRGTKQALVEWRLTMCANC